MIDKERITRQFVKLVSIDAPSYREREMADYLTKELEENESMRNSVKSAIENKMPSLAECGGFMYLHEIMEDRDKISMHTVRAAAVRCCLACIWIRWSRQKAKKQLCIRTEGSQAAAQRCSEQMICPVWQQF